MKPETLHVVPQSRLKQTIILHFRARTKWHGYRSAVAFDPPNEGYTAVATATLYMKG